MLWFLARTGSPPTVVVAGPKSLLAFWLGGAASTASVTPPPQIGGSGSTLEFPFKTRTPHVAEIIAPREKKARAKAAVQEQIDDLNLMLLLLLTD